jgi:predicted MFS family arabinose efflux permease
VSMLVLWPVSNSIGPLIAFVIINGMSNGGFFSTMPTVVGNVFGSARVSVAMGMIVTGWAGGYLLVCLFYSPLSLCLGIPVLC